MANGLHLVWGGLYFCLGGGVKPTQAHAGYVPAGSLVLLKGAGGGGERDALSIGYTYERPMSYRACYVSDIRVYYVIYVYNT